MSDQMTFLLLLFSIVLTVITSLVSSSSLRTTSRQPRNITVTPSPRLQSAFSPKNTNNPNRPFLDQWIGADSDCSVPLLFSPSSSSSSSSSSSARYILFIYADTLIGNYQGTSNSSSNPRHRVPYKNWPPGKSAPHSSVGVFDTLKNKVVNYTWGNTSYLGDQRPGNDYNDNFFWPTAVVRNKVMMNGEVCVIGIQLDKSPQKKNDPVVKGVITNGTWVVCLGNIFVRNHNSTSSSINLDASTWTQRWSLIPNTGNLSSFNNYAYSLEWRSAAYYDSSSSSSSSLNEKQDDDSYIFIFGNYVMSNDPSKSGHQVLSRIRESDFISFNWTQGLEFWTWWGEFVPLNKIFNTTSSTTRSSSSGPWINLILKSLWYGPMNSIPEFTIGFSRTYQKYFVVFVQPFSSRIVIRFSLSNKLNGDWESPGGDGDLQEVYELPSEIVKQDGAFCYAAKLHDGLLLQTDSTNDAREKFIFSYVCNMKNIGDLFEPKGANIYLPQFLEMTFA